MIFFFGQSNTLKHLIFIFIFIFNFLPLKWQQKQKNTYQSRYDKVSWQTEKEASTSKETPSSISYRKLVSRRKRGAYSNTCGNPIK